MDGGIGSDKGGIGMLSDIQCKSAKARAKAYKLADSHGLYLFVTPSGVKSWRWKYRFEGREKLIVFGRYPEISVKAARSARDASDGLRRAGTDPASSKEDASEATFEAIATRWCAQQKARWRPKHAGNVLRSLQREVFPAIGKKQIGDVTASAVLTLLRKIEARGAIDQAHRLRQRIDAVFAVAIGMGVAQINPAAMVGKALSPIVVGRYPALRTLDDARALLLAAEAAPGNPVMKLAGRFMAVTAARSEAVRYAKWPEIERGEARSQWRIPGAHMKGDRASRGDPDYEFIVPMATQALEIIDAASALNGNAPLIFGGPRDPRKPMSDSTISAMYRRLPQFSGRHVPHGWRSTFSTIMNEWAQEQGRPGDSAVIDMMLAHVRPGVEGIYNRAAYMPRRRELAQIWADMLLDGLPPPASLLEGK